MKVIIRLLIKYNTVLNHEILHCVKKRILEGILGDFVFNVRVL